MAFSAYNLFTSIPYFENKKLKQNDKTPIMHKEGRICDI